MRIKIPNEERTLRKPLKHIDEIIKLERRANSRNGDSSEYDDTDAENNTAKGTADFSNTVFVISFERNNIHSKVKPAITRKPTPVVKPIVCGKKPKLPPNTKLPKVRAGRESKIYLVYHENLFNLEANGAPIAMQHADIDETINAK
jgi:hypothetical protein